MTNPLQRMPSTEEVLKARDCSSSILYNDIAAGPVKLGPTGNGWPDSDLMAEQQARIAEGDARAAAGSPRVADADGMRRRGAC